MEIFLRYGSFFPVPAAVADNLLKLATHDQLKILLYVLCHAEEQLDSAQIVSACGVTPDAVEEALAFWQNVNILQTDAPAVLTASVGAAASPVPETAPAASPAKQTSEAPAVQPVSDSSRFHLTPTEITERVELDSAVREMFRMIEQHAGRLLHPTEMNSLIWMHEYLGLAPDLIMMLAAYCKQIDSFQVRYMEKIAVEWSERGILTHEQVQADIDRRTQSRSYVGKIMKIFGMDRLPTKKMQSYIDRWQAVGHSPELIAKALEGVRDSYGEKPKNIFGAVDGFLKKWEEAGAKTPEEAEAADAAYYNSRQQETAKVSPNTDTENTSFDPEDFDKLINRF